MARPLIRISIDELEKEFSARRGDRAFLAVLAEELSHRSVSRARALRTAVQRELSGSSHTTSPSESETPQHADSKLPLKREQTRTVDVAPTTFARPTQSKEHPPTSNDPAEILSSWIALEVLSPPAFNGPEQLAAGNRNAVASLDENELPWERGEKSRPNCRLYFQIVLGTIKMEKAISRLIEHFGDSRPDFPSSKGNAILASIIVDKEGRLVESQAISISSFGWGVMAALNGSLTDLARWPEVETEIVRHIEKELIRFGQGENDDEKRESPLSRKAIYCAFGAVLRETGLPDEMVEAPTFAIRSYEHFKNPNPPEPLLLNSFFLGDLSFARGLLRDQKAPDNLKRYLGILRPEKSSDLLRDKAALEAALAPKMTGLSRWPSPGRHSSSLLQQAAVNLSFTETGSGGMLGVNGPPGTGKTTLLRDILAGVVTERAEVMLGFDNPEAAFTHAGQKMKAGNAWLHLYRLDAKLRGFEMVVASSNNKAVENVSREIPAISSIAADADDLRYFKVLADEIHGRETWGLIAAVLGNSANRWSFKNTFWWDEEFSMNAYLSAAAGANPQVTRKNPATGKEGSAIPKIVADEKPPRGVDEALLRWNSARKRFRAVLEKSQQWGVWLESLREDLLKMDGVIAAERLAEEAQERAAERVQHDELLERMDRERLSKATAILSEQEAQSSAHRLIRPGWWSRLWATDNARAWSRENESLRNSLEQARKQALLDSQQHRDAEEVLRAAIEANRQAASVLERTRSARIAAESRLAEARQKYGVVFPDAGFFGQDHSQKHQASVWFPKAAQRVREDLFTEAMHLHRAFIDGAAKPLRNNLGVLMNVLSGNSLPGAEKEALLPDLWATLFLVVPLISTTFASVGRMLGKLPPKSLGWLLIDEAGQALPQAAVGAIIRSQKVIAVGDPAQIEPVVALPDALTHAIARSFGVDPGVYSAPVASVQTLADAASSFSTEFQMKTGSRTVGVPLLVHRRCAEPMFSVSNAIAYSGLMVQAKASNTSAIRDILGPSRWIHVEGGGEDKWCEEEGVEVVRLLHQLAEAGTLPDLYIVTPFVVVAERLREVIRTSGVLRNMVENGELWRWVNERIGTIHTVQGREAEAVILVLGAPNATQVGARGWAGGRPNLLNVAVTRAKEVLYVIGNRTLWREAGHFCELDARLE